jgi:glycosyltransferase involved in cell wall biosynthesis
MTSCPPHIRVCFLAGTLGRGGAERQLLYMLKSLQDIPVVTRVICLTEGEPVEQEIRDTGTPVEWAGSRDAHFGRLADITRSLRRERADIVQSAHFYTNTYAALAARLTGARSIGAIRNDLISEVHGNWPYGWGHLFLPQFLVANSRLARERAIQRRGFPNRIFLVENAVDVANLPKHQVRTSRERRLHLLFVGRLVPQKRADRFLRLVDRLARELPEWQIEARLAGEGPERQALESTRSTLGITPDQAVFLGEVGDVRPLYGWADLLVLTSDHEGTPNVLLEAMASGLPVVAAAVGGVPELLHNGGGLMVRPQNEDELFRAVKRVLNDPELADRLGAEGLRSSSAARSIGNLGGRLGSIYARVCGDVGR